MYYFTERPKIQILSQVDSVSSWRDSILCTEAFIRQRYKLRRTSIKYLWHLQRESEDQLLPFYDMFIVYFFTNLNNQLRYAFADDHGFVKYNQPTEEIISILTL